MTAHKKRGRPSRAQLRAAEAPGPTPETAAKLWPDAVLALVRKGRISVAQERAAREINSIWESLERAMSPSSSVVLARVNASYREPPDGMSHRMARMLRARHQPWAGREIEKTIAPGLTRYGVVWRLVNLNWPAALIARQGGVSVRAVLKALRASLDVYVSFADKDGGLG